MLPVFGEEWFKARFVVRVKESGTRSAVVRGF